MLLYCVDDNMIMNLLKNDSEFYTMQAPRTRTWLEDSVISQIQGKDSYPVVGTQEFNAASVSIPNHNYLCMYLISCNWLISQ